MKKTLFSLAAAALVLAACGKKEQPAFEAASQISATTQAAGTPKTGGAYEKQATYFKLPAAAGGELDLAAYAGKPVMVMFFTESCPYCRRAAPAIEKLYKTYAPKGLNIVGVCIQEDRQAALDFGKSLGVTFPLAYDGRAAYKNYKAQGVPYIYLLDGRHNIVDVWEGYDESYDPQMIKSIETLLASVKK
jgi:thiol-disulfide isomerase/thioredoxin